MRAEVTTAILLAVLLACLASSANCEDGDQGGWTAGGRRRQPDGEEMAGRGSREVDIDIVVCLCVKYICDNKDCYCCQTLPKTPCFMDQKACWRACPTCQGLSPPGLHKVSMGLAPASPSPGDNL
ncbi:hypothetical protein ACP70R_042873 [Stipagrostis hirtigluma subsp. patula]